MKITKKITAAEAVEEVVEQVVETPEGAVAAEPSAELTSMVFDDAKSYIHSAIKSLSAFARRAEDPAEKAKAKEAIANLGVVLLSLQ